MTSNLKVIVPVLALALVLSAVTASTASAQNATLTSSGPVTVIGQSTKPSNPILRWLSNILRCTSTVYTGHKYDVTPHTLIPSDVSTITVTAHYGSCSAEIGGISFPATVDMNGCDYILHFEGTKPGADKYAIRWTLLCDLGVHPTVTMFGSAAKHTSNEPFCHLTITQNGAGYLGFEANDTTNGKVDINGEIAGVSADKKSPTGSILCPEESTTEATMGLDITLEGKNEAGGATSISLSHL